MFETIVLSILYHLVQDNLLSLMYPVSLGKMLNREKQCSTEEFKKTTSAMFSSNTNQFRVHNDHLTFNYLIL